jgi:hypothetical protein
MNRTQNMRSTIMGIMKTTNGSDIGFFDDAVDVKLIKRYAYLDATEVESEGVD